MSSQQHERLSTVLIILCGGACWSFLLYKLYFGLTVPTLA